MSRVQTDVSASRNGRAILELPYASPIVQKLIPIYIYILFLVPGTLLDLIGYDYSSIGGSQITKIHLSTYAILVLSTLFIVTYPDKRALISYCVSQRLGSLFFFLAAAIALMNIILGKRNGFGMYFDTDLHLFLCSMLLPFVPPPLMDRLEKFIHIFFASNASLAIFELATGWRAFPLTTYSPDGYTSIEPRSTAFLTHPLYGATITCVYIVALLCGAGNFQGFFTRLVIVLFQCVALLAFGGRTAMGLTLAAIGLTSAWSAFLFFCRGKKFEYGRVLLGAITPLVVIGAIGVLFYSGMMDPLIARSMEDGGSARTRFLIWPLLTSFKWGDLLWGAPTDLVFSHIVSHGLEWGVENPFMQMVVYQGAVVATLLMTGILLTLYDVFRFLRPRSFLPLMTFLLLCNSYGSFGGRFYAFAIFIVTIGVLFRPRDNEAGGKCELYLPQATGRLSAQQRPRRALNMSLADAPGRRNPALGGR